MGELGSARHSRSSPACLAPVLLKSARHTATRCFPSWPFKAVLSWRAARAERSPSPNPQTGNAQQRRRLNTLMRHTAASCFPSRATRVDSTPTSAGAWPSGGCMPRPESGRPRSVYMSSTRGTLSRHSRARHASACRLVIPQRTRPVRMGAVASPLIPFICALARPRRLRRTCYYGPPNTRLGG
jgi:hypothetical protein